MPRKSPEGSESRCDYPLRDQRLTGNRDRRGEASPLGRGRIGCRRGVRDQLRYKRHAELEGECRQSAPRAEEAQGRGKLVTRWRDDGGGCAHGVAPLGTKDEIRSSRGATASFAIWRAFAFCVMSFATDSASSIAFWYFA